MIKVLLRNLVFYAAKSGYLPIFGFLIQTSAIKCTGIMDLSSGAPESAGSGTMRSHRSVQRGSNLNAFSLFRGATIAVEQNLRVEDVADHQRFCRSDNQIQQNMLTFSDLVDPYGPDQSSFLSGVLCLNTLDLLLANGPWSRRGNGIEAPPEGRKT